MIQVLDQHTIDKIAAGEVVERPASVVKELVENAIDAGAKAVTVEIKEGGISFIRVTDNGIGIHEDEVPTAFLRHATSKIRSIEDLLSATTLGFRGEALSSIAAVAQVELLTKTKDSLTGVRYVIEGGKEISKEEVGCPTGTTFIVRNLFYNTPVRRKYLKTSLTEMNYITSLVEQLALSRPDLSFKYIANGQTKLATQGNGDLQDVIYQIYGRDIATNLMEINQEAGDMKICGYIAKPYISRGNRSYEQYFINGRYIKSPIITKAIEEAYKTFVMIHKYPFVVMNISLNSQYLDVNVHPRKMEMRYSKGEELYKFIFQEIRHCLMHKELIPDVGRVGNTQKMRETAKLQAPEPFEEKRREQETRRITITREEQPLSGNQTEAAFVGKQEEKREAPIAYREKENREIPIEYKQTGDKETPVEYKQAGNKETPVEYKQAGNKETPVEYKQAGNKETPVEYKQAEDRDTSAEYKIKENTTSPVTYKQEEKIHVPAEQQEFTQVEEPGEFVKVKQETLFETGFVEQEKKENYHIIGQLFKTYWLIEYEDRFFILDQHAAHEKIMYERFMSRYQNREVFSQQVVPPLVISVNPKQQEAIIQNHAELTQLGFQLENFGGKDYIVRAVPTETYGIHAQDLFIELVDTLTDDGHQLNIDLLIYRIATMACKAAVKGNMKLSYAEAEGLLKQLMACENPYTCPHGRPTIVAFTKTEIERKFKRIQDR